MKKPIQYVAREYKVNFDCYDFDGNFCPRDTIVGLVKVLGFYEANVHYNGLNYLVHFRPSIVEQVNLTGRPAGMFEPLVKGQTPYENGGEAVLNKEEVVIKTIGIAEDHMLNPGELVYYFNQIFARLKKLENAPKIGGSDGH